MSALTVKDVAKMFDKHENTITRWLKNGLLKGTYKNEQGQWLIPEESVENIPKVDKIDAPIIEAANTLVGEKINDLVIIEITGYKPEGKQNKIHVKVQCECGNIVEKPLYAIKEERVKRCGRDCFLNANIEIGEKYGYLTIISEGEIRTIGQSKRRFVETKCECGNTKFVNLNKMKKGEQKSCGKNCKKWREK